MTDYLKAWNDLSTLGKKLEDAFNGRADKSKLRLDFHCACGRSEAFDLTKKGPGTVIAEIQEHLKTCDAAQDEAKQGAIEIR